MLPSPSRLIALTLLVLAMTTFTAVAQMPAATSAATTVASQGGVSVTLGDLDAFAARIPPGQRAGFFDSPTRIEGVITNLLMQKQLAAEARKSGLDSDPDVARQVALAADETLANARMQRFKAAVKVPQLGELAQEEYLAHKENYVTPGKLTVKHVLVSTKSRSEAEARTIADTVEAQARAHPDQFDALIEKYSDDPSKATNHGLLEQVGEKGKYVAAFAKAAAALAKPGDVSPVVATPYGLHVIKLVEHTPDRQDKFEEVKPAIMDKLTAEFVDKAVKGHTDALRNLPMKAEPDIVASLRTRYGVAPAIPGEPPAPTAGK